MAILERMIARELRSLCFQSLWMGQGILLMKMLLLLQLRLILQPEENPNGYWRVLEPRERLKVDTRVVSNGRRRICRRTRLGFLMVIKNAFLVVFGQ